MSRTTEKVTRILQYAPNGTFYISIPKTIIRDLELKKQDVIAFSITRDQCIKLTPIEEEIQDYE